MPVTTTELSKNNTSRHLKGRITIERPACEHANHPQQQRRCPQGAGSWLLSWTEAQLDCFSGDVSPVSNRTEPQPTATATSLAREPASVWCGTGLAMV